jgi:predicted patatin/cPLA2 family phospholipase
MSSIQQLKQHCNTLQKQHKTVLGELQKLRGKLQKEKASPAQIIAIENIEKQMNRLNQPLNEVIKAAIKSSRTSADLARELQN